jgi:hypothetical protein
MEALVPINPELIGLIAGSFTKGGLPMPFVREIFLMECHIAGTTYVNIKELEPDLNTDDILIFRRDSNNAHDPLAILILDKSGNKLGYVPKTRNEVIARLMDAGKMIFGKLAAKTWFENWLKVEIKVFLRDL